MQQKTLELRLPLIADIRGAAARLGQSVNLILDVTGKTLSGVPFVVLHPLEADITSRIASGLEGKDSGNVNSARNLKVATVDMNKVFTQLNRTKEAEGKINASRQEAEVENKRRVDAYKEELAKVNNLSGAAKDQQAETAQAMLKDLNDFRVKKSAELQQELVGFGQPILADMATALGKLAGDKVGLVFDATGQGISGVAILFWSRDLPDLSGELTATLNGEKPDLSKLAGTPSAKMRFGLIDIERTYKSLPEGRQTELELQEADKKNTAESANADPQTQAQKQRELQTLASSKRQAVLSKINGAVNEVGRASDFSAIFDLNGKTLNGTPVLILARDLPDLTNDVLAKLSPAK